MSRLARLKHLEVRYKPAEKMLGSIEVHCVGGWQRVEGGQECKEHERCAFSCTPLPTPIRRLIIMQWQEGMGNPFELG